MAAIIMAYLGRLARPLRPPWSLLPGMVLVSGLCFPAIAAAGHDFRVAVVDMFYNQDLDSAHQCDLIAADAPDIDGDGLRETIYHGDLVRLYVGSEGVETVPFRVTSDRPAKPQLLARLREIKARAQVGEGLDAVMFCWESSTLISAFSDSLDPGQRVRYQDIVRRWGETDEGWRLTYEIILALEDLANQGLLVVTIAGNSGPAWINTYTFAQGVMAVGASELDPDCEWATSNALIDTFAQSNYVIHLVSEHDRPVYGYDINEDGIADIDLRRGSSYYNSFGILRDSQRRLKGTSFAAPTALRLLIASRARTR